MPFMLILYKFTRMIKKPLSCLIAVVITLSGFSQSIKLTQTKSARDIKITNGQYTLYMNDRDVVAAISKVDSAMQTNNSTLIAQIKNSQLRSVDLSSKQPQDKAFIDLLKSNIGCLLLLQGKATIYKGATIIKQIVADQGPEERDLDGSARAPILFSEEGSDSALFLGKLSTKLKVE